MNSFTRFVCLLLLALIALAAYCSMAHARAGGGEGFSSGSSGGGGGGSGGWDGGSSEGWDSGSSSRDSSSRSTSSSNRQRRDDDYIFGIVVAVFIFISFVIPALSAMRSEGKTLARGRNDALKSAESRAIRILSEADPDFDPDLFYARVNTAFNRLQQGWSNQDISAIRPFASDGIVERFTLQIQDQKDRGIRNVVDSVSITQNILIGASITPVFLTATVSVTASAVDYDVDASGKIVRGNSRFADSFTELWTFVRRPGPGLDPAKPGLLEGHCPNCGVLIDDQGAQSLKCTSCGSLLTAGSHDWVLAEISQVTVKNTHATPETPSSITDYQKKLDPGFSTAHIEDRASVIFWRWAKAHRMGNNKPLQKVADKPFCDMLAGVFHDLADHRAGARRFVGNCAVGGVQALGVISGDEWEQAVVKIEWSGTTLTVASASGGTAVPQAVKGEGIYCVSILILSRRKGVVTNPAFGLSSAHCPACGAPESDASHDSCAFCSRVLNDGAGDWLLTALDTQNMPAANAILKKLAQVNRITNPVGPIKLVPAPMINPAVTPAISQEPWSAESMGMVIWLARIIVADGHITNREREIFDVFCNRHSMPPSRTQAVLDTACREYQAGIKSIKPPDSIEARRWLARLAAVMFEMGSLHASDRQILQVAAQHLGLAAQDVVAIEKSARHEALAKARDLRKQSRPARG